MHSFFFLVVRFIIVEHCFYHNNHVPSANYEVFILLTTALRPHCLNDTNSTHNISTSAYKEKKDCSVNPSRTWGLNIWPYTQFRWVSSCLEIIVQLFTGLKSYLIYLFTYVEKRDKTCSCLTLMVKIQRTCAFASGTTPAIFELKSSLTSRNSTN